MTTGPPTMPRMQTTAIVQVVVRLMRRILATQSQGDNGGTAGGTLAPLHGTVYLKLWTSYSDNDTVRRDLGRPPLPSLRPSRGRNGGQVGATRWNGRKKHAILRNEPTDFEMENNGYHSGLQGVTMETYERKRWVRFGKRTHREGVK